jgi:hypothetical protein
LLPGRFSKVQGRQTATNLDRNRTISEVLFAKRFQKQ